MTQQMLQKIPEPTMSFETPLLDRHALRDQHEKEWADAVLRAQSPIIIVCDNASDTIGGISTVIAGAMPCVPVVYETKPVFYKGQKSRFLCEEFKAQSVGYCALADKNGLNHTVFNQSDLIIFVGQPTQETLNALRGKPHIVADQNSVTPNISYWQIRDGVEADSGIASTWKDWSKKVCRLVR